MPKIRKPAAETATADAPKKVAAKTVAKKTAKVAKTAKTKKSAPAAGKGRSSLPTINRESQVAKVLPKLQKSLGIEDPAKFADKVGLRLTQVRKLLDSGYHGASVALLEQIADATGKTLTINFK